MNRNGQKWTKLGKVSAGAKTSDVLSKKYFLFSFTESKHEPFYIRDFVDYSDWSKVIKSANQIS